MFVYNMAVWGNIMYFQRIGSKIRFYFQHMCLFFQSHAYFTLCSAMGKYLTGLNWQQIDF
jgi:hypothetical protein